MDDLFKELKDLAMSEFRSAADLMDRIEHMENYYHLNGNDKLEMLVRINKQLRNDAKLDNSWTKLDELEDVAWSKIQKNISR